MKANLIIFMAADRFNFNMTVQRMQGQSFQTWQYNLAKINNLDNSKLKHLIPVCTAVPGSLVQHWQPSKAFSWLSSFLFGQTRTNEANGTGDIGWHRAGGCLQADLLTSSNCYWTFTLENWGDFFAHLQHQADGIFIRMNDNISDKCCSMACNWSKPCSNTNARHCTLPLRDKS